MQYQMVFVYLSRWISKIPKCHWTWINSSKMMTIGTKTKGKSTVFWSNSISFTMYIQSLLNQLGVILSFYNIYAERVLFNNQEIKNVQLLMNEMYQQKILLRM